MSVLEANNKGFGVKFVQQHAERSGNVASRLRWFETFAAHSELYQLIAKPLMSMRTVRSIDVERRVKPLKDTILTKRGTVSVMLKPMSSTVHVRISSTS